MAERPDSLIESAERLCETLERIGDALVALDANALLETEGTLEQLLAVIASADHTVHDKDALERLVGRAAAALVRCRQLGGSFSGIAGTRLRLRTGVETYGRDGAFTETQLAGSAVKVTT